jgi:hypothetical protein
MSNIQEKYPTLIPSCISIAMLLLAIPPIWPYGYYTLLRWVVCGTSLFIAYTAYGLNRKFWMWLIGLVAILFNPLIPVYLDKETWVVIDVVVAVVIFTSIWFLKNDKK